VATISRIDKITGLFCRLASLLWGSFAKETCKFIDPTNISHHISSSHLTKKFVRSAKKSPAYTASITAYLQKEPNIYSLYYCISAVNFAVMEAVYIGLFLRIDRALLAD